ncbi:hypothetical protein HanRHA438_Chr13g0613721 [Helianthus annuus]|nr:hypothetical protein HanRHA438_Chr13g0613721 [Helianthus annuus]
MSSKESMTSGGGSVVGSVSGVWRYEPRVNRVEGVGGRVVGEDDGSRVKRP